MGVRRAVLVLVAAAVCYGMLRAVSAWLAERRRKTVFPAKDARALLNPARRLVMPPRKTLERFGIDAGQTLLEVGPGPGYYTIEASRMAGPTGRVLCLDIQRDMLDMLRERLAANGVANVDLIQADGQALPLRAGAVDTAFLVTVLGEVPRPDSVLSELRRVIRPGGALGFSESFGDPDYVTAGTLRRLCGEESFEEAGHWRQLAGYTSKFTAPGQRAAVYPHPPL